MDTFKLTIAEDRATVYSGPARYCRISTPEGVMGFEPRHEPFAGILLPGSDMEYTEESGEEHSLRISWGTLLFEDNACTVTLGGAAVD